MRPKKQERLEPTRFQTSSQILVAFRKDSARFWKLMDDIKERERKAWLRMKKGFAHGNR